MRVRAAVIAATVIFTGWPVAQAAASGRARAQAPLEFVANQGQTDRRVRYYATGARHGFYATRRALVMDLFDADGRRGVTLALRFPRARVTGSDRATGRLTMLRGSRARQLRAFRRLVYHRLWPGVDLRLQGRAGELKYEFRVRPGARVRDIRLDYRGTRGLALHRDRGLSIRTARGVLRDSRPVTYQEIGGRRVPVASRFVLRGKRSYGFAVGAHDPRRELIIDPSVAYSTFLGGASHESGDAIAADAAGNAYVTGFTQSPDFPTTTGAFDRTGAQSNSLDAFVTKLNPAGTAAVYSTFLGGSEFDWGRGIAVDAAGSAYVAGQTKSSNFPTTGGAFDRSFNVGNCPRCGIDQYDAFVAKLNPEGSALVYSTFLGGTDLDDALAIALDEGRNAYVAGQTGSASFPTTAGAFDTSANGSFDGFVTKLNPAGSALVYSTRLGGEDNELPNGVAVDAAGNAFVGGGTRSTGFPTTPGAFDTTQNGGAFDERFDLFATKLNPSGSALVYSTFVGGSKSDFGEDFAIDASGNAYLAGVTLSPDFPTTPGAFDPVFADGEGTVTKLNPAGSALVYSTYFGEAFASAVAPAANGEAWVSGSTSSPTAPTTADAFDRSFNGGTIDAYVARLNANGTALGFASFLGGADSESANDVALDPAGDVYLAGHTYSPDFPTTAGAFDRTFAGDPLVFWGEAFVTKLGGSGPPPPPPPPPPLVAPTLISPPNDARFSRGQPITFDWSDVAGAASYTIHVDDSSAFGSPYVLNRSVTPSQLTISSLPAKRLWWRVRAKGSSGPAGPWSAVRSLEVR